MSTITFTAGSTTTVTNFAVTGTAGNPVTINSSVPGTRFTLSQASGIVIVNYASIQDSNVTGGATWIASNSTDLGDNLGWIFGLYKQGLGSSINSAGVLQLNYLNSQFDETQTLTYTPYVGTTSGSISFNNNTASTNYFANTTGSLAISSAQNFTTECWFYLKSYPSNPSTTWSSGIFHIAQPSVQKRKIKT